MNCRRNGIWNVEHRGCYTISKCSTIFHSYGSLNKWNTLEQVESLYHSALFQFHAFSGCRY